MINISEEEYNVLKHKSNLYDKMIESRKKGAKKTNMALSKKDRSERAKRAVEARIKKYNQKRKKNRKSIDLYIG